MIQVSVKDLQGMLGRLPELAQTRTDRVFWRAMPVLPRTVGEPVDPPRDFLFELTPAGWTVWL